MTCPKCGAGDKNEMQPGYTSGVSGIFCQRCGFRLTPMTEMEVLKESQPTVDAALTEALRLKGERDIALASLDREKAAHQATREEHSALQDKLRDAEGTFKQMQAQFGSVIMAEKVATGKHVEYQKNIESLEGRVKLLSDQMSQGIDAAIGEGIVQRVEVRHD